MPTAAVVNRMKDFEYMQMALSLAERGAGEVEPNPAVGCVIVKHENIIGKGYHKVFAGPHAEIEALDDCRNNGFDPAGADMYVTLEPCCHYGKTGPCTEAIIKAGIVRVFLSMVDPSEHANGQGIEKLRQADIEVQTGLCEKEASELNAPFIKRAKTGPPGQRIPFSFLFAAVPRTVSLASEGKENKRSCLKEEGS